MIKFFPTKAGNMVSHHAGLTFAQIQFLKGMKVGQQLIMYSNEDGTAMLRQLPQHEEPQKQKESTNDHSS